MNRNDVLLEDIIWVVGYETNKAGKRIYLPIPYIIETNDIGNDVLYNLTSCLNLEFNGKVTIFEIIKTYKQTYKNATLIDMAKSENIIKKYVLNNDNRFKNEIFSMQVSVLDYCGFKILNKETGSNLIKEIKIGLEECNKEQILD